MSEYSPSGIKKLYHATKRDCAQAWLKLFHPIQIGITGSQGKTNTTAIVTTIFREYGSTVRTDQSLDTTYNVPLTALRVRPWTQFLIWELGIDHPGEMARHLEIAHPTIACITGISPVHTDAEHMGSFETLLKEKQLLITDLPAHGTAILNRDNEYVRAMAPQTKAQVQWFGMSPECTMWTDPKTISISLTGTSATCYIQDGNTSRAIQIETGLIGAFHFYNIMASYLIVKAAVPAQNRDEVFQKVMKEMRPLPGRMSVENGPLETVLLNDSLRANPESTQAGLETLNKMQYSKGRKIAVIGEMGELEKPEEEHTQTGAQIAELDIDYVICIGPLRKYTIEEAVKRGYSKEKIVYAENVFEAADLLKKILRKDDLWYLKGSLLRNYSRILKLLRGEEVCCDAVLCPYSHCK